MRACPRCRRGWQGSCGGPGPNESTSRRGRAARRRRRPRFPQHPTQRELTSDPCPRCASAEFGVGVHAHASQVLGRDGRRKCVKVAQAVALERALFPPFLRDARAHQRRKSHPRFEPHPSDPRSRVARGDDAFVETLRKQDGAARGRVVRRRRCRGTKSPGRHAGGKCRRRRPGAESAAQNVDDVDVTLGAPGAGALAAGREAARSGGTQHVTF